MFGFLFCFLKYLFIYLALRQKHNIRSTPIRKDDEQIGQVVQVYRKKYNIYTEQCSGGRPSKTGKDHTKILEHKAKSCQGAKEKGKYKEETTEKMRE
ncbi:hypothetical protein AB1E18_017796 [Capra hircus]